MPTLPSGTVTFVFTDIEGSTELLKQLGDLYGELLSAHRRLVRTTFETMNGIEIDNQGDAFFFAFPRARDAVGAAVQAQRAHASTVWPGDSVVRVRMGLHTGEPSVDDEGYLGLDVVRAARICTVAHGGQVLLSEATRGLLGSGMPDDVSVFPLGERHLRSIDEPERIYELAIEGLHTEQVQDLEAVEHEATPTRSEESGKDEFDRSVEDLSARYAARIRQDVLRSLEGVFGQDRRPARADEGQEDADVDDLAARASALQERITARVEAAMRARGLPRGGSS
jgi:class 3 adenylate cyclase